ncbi:hypothetical protein KLP28_11080 [Nocardioidaceae bacterium]|nr:hypothetical protein KLP28_11080 [Nocardioidaceae bacterium]
MNSATPTASGPLLPRARRAWWGVRRALILHRRRWALLLVLLAVVTALAATQGTKQPLTPVVVARADLTAGSVVTREDLEVRGFTPESVPSSAEATPDRLLGRTLAVPVRRGEPVGLHRLAGGEQRGTAPGLTTVPVRIVEASQLLRDGDVVDLVAADGQGEALTVARTLPVVGRVGELVLLGVPAAQVDAVVGASSAGYLFYTFSP